MRYLSEQSIEDIASGAGILGAGGGGEPHLGTILARAAIREHGSVPIVAMDEVPDDALIVPVAMMGAPTVSNEKLASLDGMVAAVNAISSGLSRKATHIIAAEVGGINSLLPVAVAAEIGLPLVDADLMGRAFPELQMAIPTLYGIPASPVAMTDERGNTLILRTVNNEWTERLARVVTTEMGASSLISLYAMSGRQARDSVVLGSLTLSETLGRTRREAVQANGDPVAAVMGVIGGHRLITGKLTDLDRRTAGGFSRMEVIIEGVGSDKGSMISIRSQNEHLLAEMAGVVVASTPDLIIVLDSVSGDPITTEGLRFGVRVTVLTSPCDPRYRTEAGLKLVGPRAFGYDVDYVPCEARGEHGVAVAPSAQPAQPVQP